jgi:putative cardiolipin synthase
MGTNLDYCRRSGDPSAYIDGETVLIGSMNLDPRSEHTNNEIGVIVHSREVTQRMLSVFNTDRNLDYEVELGADGTSLACVSRTGGREERDVAEPDRACGNA